MNLTIALIVPVMGLMAGMLASTPAFKETIDKLWDARRERLVWMGLLVGISGLSWVANKMGAWELIPLIASLPIGFGLGKSLDLASSWARLRLLRSGHKLLAMKIEETKEEREYREVTIKEAKEVREKLFSILAHVSPNAAGLMHGHINAIVEEKLPALFEQRVSLRLAIEDSEPHVKKVRDSQDLPAEIRNDSIKDLRTFRKEREQVESDIQALVAMLHKAVSDCHELRVDLPAGRELTKRAQERIQKLHNDAEQLIQHEHDYHEELRAQEGESPLDRARRQVAKNKRTSG